jgi:hypothetical protein
LRRRPACRAGSQDPAEYNRCLNKTMHPAKLTCCCETMAPLFVAKPPPATSHTLTKPPPDIWRLQPHTPLTLTGDGGPLDSLPSAPPASSLPIRPARWGGAMPRTRAARYACLFTLQPCAREGWFTRGQFHQAGLRRRVTATLACFGERRGLNAPCGHTRLHGGAQRRHAVLSGCTWGHVRRLRDWGMYGFVPPRTCWAMLMRSIALWNAARSR